MVQVAVAGDATEAEELRELLQNAGIDSEVGAAGDDVLPRETPPSAVPATP
jgi:hypothetical protein